MLCSSGVSIERSASSGASAGRGGGCCGTGVGVVLRREVIVGLLGPAGGNPRWLVDSPEDVRWPSRFNAPASRPPPNYTTLCTRPAEAGLSLGHPGIDADRHSGRVPPVPGVEYVGRTEYFSGSPTPPHALLRPAIHSNNEDHPGRRRLSDHAPDDHGRAAGARG